MTLKSDPNFGEKLTFYLKNDMNNLVNFNLSSGKSGNLHFDQALGTFFHIEGAQIFQKGATSRSFEAT